MIYLASDHRGMDLKSRIKSWLHEWGMPYEDCGPFNEDPLDDYPDYVKPAAEKVAADPAVHRAIVLGATGQGEAMVCNRFPGVRATVYYGGTKDILTMSREHNDANVLALGAAFMEPDEVKIAIHLWLNAKFSQDERHIRRIKKIDGK